MDEEAGRRAADTGSGVGSPSLLARKLSHEFGDDEAEAEVKRAEAEVDLGLGRSAVLHRRSSTLCQIH